MIPRPLSDNKYDPVDDENNRDDPSLDWILGMITKSCTCQDGFSLNFINDPFGFDSNAEIPCTCGFGAKIKPKSAISFISKTPVGRKIEPEDTRDDPHSAKPVFAASVSPYFVQMAKEQLESGGGVKKLHVPNGPNDIAQRFGNSVSQAEFDFADDSLEKKLMAKTGPAKGMNDKGFKFNKIDDNVINLEENPSLGGVAAGPRMFHALKPKRTEDPYMVEYPFDRRPISATGVPANGESNRDKNRGRGQGGDKRDKGKEKGN